MASSIQSLLGARRERRQSSNQRRRAGAALAAWTTSLSALIASCAGAPPPAAPPSGEFVVGPEAQHPESPEPAKPQLRPCTVGDAGGCAVQPAAPAQLGEAAAKPELDPDRRYHVPVAPDDPTLGPTTAVVTVIVFSDFQCPFCKHLKPTLKRLRSEYPQTLRIVWKDMPLPMHDFAQLAAQVGRAAYAAGGSKLFWQVNDAIYARQDDLNEATLQQLCSEYNLPWPIPAQLNQHVLEDWELANQLNIRFTPTSFVNGRPISGARDYDAFETLVKQELQSKPPRAPTPRPTPR